MLEKGLPSNSVKTKIALLGGSFDPVHLGHIAMGLRVLAAGLANQVWFLPAAYPPHKVNYLPFVKRLQLLHTALAGIPGLSANALDYNATGHTFTYDLLLKLNRAFPEYEFLFLIGEDNVNSLPTWYHWKELLDLTKFLVLTRNGTDKTTWDNLPYLDKLVFLPMPAVDVSSTMVRSCIKHGKPLNGLVPEQIIADLQTFRSYYI